MTPPCHNTWKGATAFGRREGLTVNALEKLSARTTDAGPLSSAAFDDLPDGIDLDCTEPDFASFEAGDQYRPKHSAGALRNAFLAIFSSTAGWDTVRGTGLIATDALESRIP